ncbi:DUF4440 domain-containing protein [Streptosporangium carneum]|uniref:DUF4440 domain-containing protein n=1 Tax=Streptosporangium carneum TaxID=47481 RepID=A0A9W6MDX1_9ACTN|nr:DUF4440 domain-containing protein [Streptosporangium carneum]GLK10360.1 hypothetical protein GCM10017600_37660 [Streptosporangium carneum]
MPDANTDADADAAVTSAAGSAVTSAVTSTDVSAVTSTDVSADVSAGAAQADAEAISAGIDDMYDAFLRADRARFDGHLHAEVTTWESHLPGPLRTRAELDAYRDERDRSGARPALAGLSAWDKRIDVWGDTGVARYVLVAEPHDGPAEHSRVTDVLRRADGVWLIVHHHSELLGS